MDLIGHLDVVNSICIIVLWVLVFINRNHIFKDNSTGGTNYFVLWLIATLFSMFYMPVDGDVYTGYQFYYEYLASGNRHHMEDIYFWLMDHLPHNFYLYRFVIWGTASFFLVQTFKKLNCQSPLSTLVFVSSCLIICYYYLRNVLGFCILYYVVACICTEERSKGSRILFRYLWYALLLVASYFLHRSMPLYYAVVLVALFLPSNRYVILFLALLLPVVRLVVPSLVNTVMLSGILNQETVELGSGYLEYSEGYDYNFMGRLLRVFGLLPYIYVMVLGIFTLPTKRDRRKRPMDVFLLTALFLFSSSFLFADQYSYSLHLRLLNTSFLPMTFFISKYMEDKRENNSGRVFSLLLIVYYALVLGSRIV